MPKQITASIESASEQDLVRIRAAYERKVQRRDGCWGWHGSTKNGVGIVKARPYKISACRVALWIATGSWPEARLRVFRTCDGGPECTNPEHLCVGTLADSARNTIRRNATIIGRSVPAAERFWSKVKCGHTEDCWLWQGGCDHAGYGVFNGPEHKAHRMAWHLTRGPIPARLFVLHSCDNPQCCNPEHLFLGTNADNMADMKAKRRASWGTSSARAKLTVEDVVVIRNRAETGETHASIAIDFPVNASQISRIVNKKQWRYL